MSSYITGQTFYIDGGICINRLGEKNYVKNDKVKNIIIDKYRVIKSLFK